MTRALVLGGGGPVGIGWEAGLLVGLANAGVMLGLADVVVGTSAGAVVGAQLTAGRELAGVVLPMTEAPPWASGESGTLDLGEMLARGGEEISEADFVARFDFLNGIAWPANFRCVSVDVDSGRFALWDGGAGVEIHRAAASSCSVPGLSPPVTIAGARYFDGGARDMLNADLASGHDVVVAVSCVVLAPPDGLIPDLLAGLLTAVRNRLDELRSSGSAVEVIEPSSEFGELSGWGRYLMDFGRTASAFDAGLAQGTAEAARIGSLWTSRRASEPEG